MCLDKLICVWIIICLYISCKSGFLYGLRPKSFLSTSQVKLHEMLAIWLAILIDSEGFSDMTFSRIFWHFYDFD